MEDKKLILSHSIFPATSDELIDGYLLFEGDKITELKPGMPSSDLLNSAKVYDYRGMTVTPGLVDPHTHLVHGGSRENELALKLAGASYMEVHKEGGIKSTVKHTREASNEELYDKAYKTMQNMLLHGTTTVEGKSGYGLDKDTEIRVLEVNRALHESHAIDLVSTYMGAHDVPKEYESTDAYIKFMIEEVMPVVKERELAEFLDIFCEDKIYSLEETRKIAEAAKEMGFKLKVHADEIEPMGGAGLAAELGATSAEHLMAISDVDIKKMAKSGTVAVLLPATTFFLRAKNFAPAKKMLKEGVTVAIATDYNPGSSPCENMQMAMDQACLGMGLLPREILIATTINAAKAVCRDHLVGSLEPGKQADICVFDAKSPEFMSYHFGINNVAQVFKRGEHVVQNGQICNTAFNRAVKNKVK